MATYQPHSQRAELSWSPGGIARSICKTIRAGASPSGWSPDHTFPGPPFCRSSSFLWLRKPSRDARTRLPNIRLACRCSTGRRATAPSKTTSFATTRANCASASQSTLPDEGRTKRLRIDIPVGGYVPVFNRGNGWKFPKEERPLSGPVSIESQSAHVARDSEVASSHRMELETRAARRGTL